MSYSYEHPERGKQLILFDDMVYQNNARPTDVDALIEYKDKAWVIVEVKHRNKPVPVGQEIAYERLAHDLSKTGKPTLYIVAEHSIDDPRQEVQLRTCSVRGFVYDNKWYKAKMSVGRLVDSFLQAQTGSGINVH